MIVFDLEATCWDWQNRESTGDWHGKSFEIDSPGWKQQNEMETIEIGAVKVKNKNYEIIDQFQTFVRPVLNPELTDFCKNLTTIEQKDVDNAPYFKEAYISFRDWAKHPNFFMAWGRYDYKQLKRDASMAGINIFPEYKYLNAKEEYFKLTGRRGRGLGKAAKHYKLEFEGVHHRGISDAIMVANVMKCAQKELNDAIRKRMKI